MSSLLSPGDVLGFLDRQVDWSRCRIGRGLCRDAKGRCWKEGRRCLTHTYKKRGGKEREGSRRKSERREEKSEKEGLVSGSRHRFCAWSVRLVGKTTSRGRSSFSMNVLPAERKREREERKKKRQKVKRR
ncbi:uncharacterized protein LOC114946664 [Nylanderia fulva]|uniref:uncharacterized protein LOC114946664 n=1 Tax=Nylanderia fulva TaxID=613905 RepID=UPI0010FAF866|nr:uncharacterized protein LOC114946664 [Nylanderia fulva]